MRATTKSSWIIAIAVLSMALAVPAAASAAWGSIALNPKTGQAGVSFNDKTKAKAANHAEKDCPGKCQAVLFVRNKCGAIAVNSRRYVPGFGNSKRKAIKKARKKAGKAPGKEKLVAFVCSG